MSHLPGHVRQPALDAIEALYRWLLRARRAEPMPMVTFENHYAPHQITIAEACGLVRLCTDILPAPAFQMVTEIAEMLDLPIRRRTFAAAARVMLTAVRKCEVHT
jgi:hypothetical protein